MSAIYKCVWYTVKNIHICIHAYVHWVVIWNVFFYCDSQSTIFKSNSLATLTATKLQLQKKKWNLEMISFSFSCWAVSPSVYWTSHQLQNSNFLKHLPPSLLHNASPRMTISQIIPPDTHMQTFRVSQLAAHPCDPSHPRWFLCCSSKC